MNKYNLAAKFAILAAFFFVADVHSSDFNVNPVRVYLDGKTRSGTIVVESLSDEVLTIQASMNAWTQQDGRDDLIVPTEDMMVSPPIFKIQPRSRQVVRVGNLKKPDASREGAYRLYLEEVPPPRKPGDEGITVSMRISLPIFIAPASGRVQSALKWKAVPVDAKNFDLVFSNSGTGHIQISAISIRLQDGFVLAENPEMMTYILPGQSHTFKLKTKKPWTNEPLRVMIKSDAAVPGVETEVKPD